MDSQSPAEIARLLAEHRLQVVDHRAVQEERAPRERTLGDDTELSHQLWLQSAAGEDATRLIMTLRSDSRVDTASPVYHRADLRPAVSGLSFTDQVLVRLDPAVNDAQVDELMRSLGTEVVSVVPIEQYGAVYQVRVAQNRDSIEVVRALERSPLVTYAGVDWRQLTSPACGWTPDDPDLPSTMAPRADSSAVGVGIHHWHPARHDHGH